MYFKDILLVFCVIIAWGFNFVVIKFGLHSIPPFLLAGLRFTLVAFPALFFIKPPQIPIRLLLLYGMTISFGQFSFLFSAISMGMPAGISSLILQTQAFFTILLGAFIFHEKLKWNHILGMFIAIMGILLLVVTHVEGQVMNNISFITLLLTLAAALSWGFGNITNKIITNNYPVSMISLVVWSALVPILPFFVCSWIFEGQSVILNSLMHINSQTISALIYLAFIATIMCYALWGKLLSKYETWRIAPLSLLVPIIGIFSAVIFLGESLSFQQCIGAIVILIGLLVNLFGNICLSKIKSMMLS